MKYDRIAMAELKADIYGGKECNEHVKEWHGQFYDEEMMEIETIELHKDSFPIGTKIYIEVPLCPSCSMEQSMCECGFNWKQWIENEYC